MKKEFTMPEVEFVANEPLRTQAITGADIFNQISKIVQTNKDVHDAWGW